MQPSPLAHRLIRLLPAAALAWLVVAGLVVAELWPHLPRSRAQWALLLTLGPPLCLLVEWIVARLLSDERGRAISTRAFSPARVAVALTVAVLVGGAVWWLAWLVTGV